jgi:hypothetical protein
MPATAATLNNKASFLMRFMRVSCLLFGVLPGEAGHGAAEPA